MRHAVPAFLLAAVAAAPQAARADFQLAPQRPAAAQTLPAEWEPINPPPGRPAPARRPTAPAALPPAQGFGRQVPLAFAARQIVPAGVRVAFGPDVDPDAPVDWSGGRPWDEALRAAVRPLGLRVVVRWREVAVTRG